MIKHKKINELICEKYYMKYYNWKWWVNPTNYTYFTPINWGDDLFFIEKIPKWKYYKTFYIWFIQNLENKKEIVDYIVSLYKKETEKNDNICIYSPWLINLII